MTLFMSKLMSGIVELLIVSVIPFITWLIWSRKKVGFFFSLTFFSPILDPPCFA